MGQVELVVASQLNDYVCSNGLENVKQSAYKLGHSTETALLSIKNDVHLALARGEATAVVLLDQSAAFDTIDHGTLLDCLSVLVWRCWHSYPTALKGCRGIVFTHAVRMGGRAAGNSLSGLYLRNRKV